jgi:hypothetical protein
MKISPLLISPVLFLVACCIPALEFSNTQGGPDVMWGGNILAVGWSGIFAGVFGWYANPFWLLGLVLGFVHQRWVAVGAGVLSAAIASTTFLMFGQVLPADEGNVNHMTLIRLLPGFYVWMASLAAVPVLALLEKRR